MRDVLKGVILDGFFWLISVALVRVFTNNTNNAALGILKHNNRAPCEATHSKVEVGNDVSRSEPRREESSFDLLLSERSS